MGATRLGELKKYVPFMDYILTLDYQYKDKFEKMRKWIVENKKFAKDYFEKIEQSIIVTYKDIGRHKGFPSELHKIFTVDLCSDDDESGTTSKISKKISQPQTQDVLSKKTVNIRDIENGGDVELVSVIKSSVVDLTKDKNVNKDNERRHNISTSSGSDINEEIFTRINATASIRNDLKQSRDNHFSVEMVENEDRLIFKRRKDLTPNRNTLSGENIDITNAVDNNIAIEESPCDEIRPKIKKKKKKHKKNKRHRHNKHRLRKKNFKVIDNIVIDSSSDDESASNNALKSTDSVVETALPEISNLNELELLKIKIGIINQIESETIKEKRIEPSKSKEIENGKDNETSNGTSNGNVKDTVSDKNINNELDEAALLQIKNNLMKTMGVDLDINTSELLEDINLGELIGKPSSSHNVTNGGILPTSISKKDVSLPPTFQTNHRETSSNPGDVNSVLADLLHSSKVAESNNQPKSDVYKPIPTIQNIYTHISHTSVYQSQESINPHIGLSNLNKTIPVHISPPTINNRQPNVNTTNITTMTIGYHQKSNIRLPTTGSNTLPTLTHLKTSDQSAKGINYGYSDAMQSVRPPPLVRTLSTLMSTESQPFNTTSEALPLHPAVARQQYSSVSQPIEPSASQLYHPAVIQNTHIPVHQSLYAPGRQQIQHSTTQPLHPAVLQQPQPSVKHLLHQSAPQPLYPGISQQQHSAVPQPLHPPAAQPVDRGISQQQHSAVPQPLHPPTAQPLHRGISQHPHSAVPHPLHPPATQPLHRGISQQPHSAVRQSLHPPAPQPLHRGISQQPHPAVAQPLYPSAPQYLHPGISHKTHSAVAQPLHSSSPHPVYPAVTQSQSYPTVPQNLHPPAPSQSYPTVPQTLHPPAPSHPYPQTLQPLYKTQNAAMLSENLPSQSSFSIKSILDKTLHVKDPRLRKIQEQNHYGINHSNLVKVQRPNQQESNQRQQPTMSDFQTTSSKTKSPITYGEYVRKMKEKKQLDAEMMKQQREAAERKENQQKLEEKQRKLLIEQEQEKIELERQTENIKQILSKRNVMDILNEMVSKGQNHDKNKKNSNDKIDSNEKEIKHQQDKESVTDGPKIIERRKSCSSKSRALKELECTVKGFNTIQDFMLNPNEGKRRSSVCARLAIASLMSPFSETVYIKASSNESSPKSPPKTRKRRNSMASIDDEIEEVARLRKDLEVRVKKAKSIPKMKKCKVILHKLSLAEIEKYTKTPNPINKSNPEKNTEPAATSTKSSETPRRFTASAMNSPLLERTSQTFTDNIQRKTGEKTYARKSTDSFMDVKNIDCEMTERNCDKCVLCNSRSTNLTNHYIRFHRRESYLSRLTWEELDDLQMKIPFAEEVPIETNSFGANKKIQRFKVECPFCPEENREVVGSFAMLRQHYSMHTGEYPYQCKGCGLQKPLRKDIVDHQKRTKCIGMGLQTIYLYPTDLMVIYMYVCNICNFVQLNEENVFKHLREQHGKLNRDGKLVKQFTLAAIKDGPLERVPVGNFAETISSMDQFFDSDLFSNAHNDQIVVGNEPLLDESFNICKPEPSGDDNEFIWNSPVLQIESMEKENGEASAGSKKLNVMECMETSTIDIKPEINIMDQSTFENGKQPEILGQSSGSAFIEETAREECEDKPDVEKLAAESAKALLRKYSANTGIRPDLLYQCPKPDCRGYYSNFNLWSCHMSKRHNSIISTCPHCKNINAELRIPDFEQHFGTHCMRLYVCFHCDTQCLDEIELKNHAKHAHSDIEEVRIECIPISFSYAYHVLVNKNALTVRLDFLLELCNILRARIQRMEALAEESDAIVSQWTISNNPAWLDDLSIPVFHPSAANPKCIFPSCTHSFVNPLDLVDHWKEKHNTYKDHLFSCRLCGTSSPSKTLMTLVKHNFMHAEYIFVCCVCSYMTYDRKLLSKHICAEHDKRDVGVLLLQRSKSVIKVKIEFVFAAGSKTFSTTNSCFCGCGAKNLRVDTYVSHLKREHSLKLHYFCEHCGERLLQLQSSDEHFLLKHASETRSGNKIRCQLVCSYDRKVNILSIRPMQIRLSDENYENFQNDFGSPKKDIDLSKTVIKPEIEDTECDEPILMEDDEIVAENEAKQVQSLQNIERRDISVKSIWKLF